MLSPITLPPVYKQLATLGSIQLSYFLFVLEHWYLPSCKTIAGISLISGPVYPQLWSRVGYPLSNLQLIWLHLISASKISLATVSCKIHATMLSRNFEGFKTTCLILGGHVEWFENKREGSVQTTNSSHWSFQLQCIMPLELFINLYDRKGRYWCISRTKPYVFFLWKKITSLFQIT